MACPALKSHPRYPAPIRAAHQNARPRPHLVIKRVSGTATQTNTYDAMGNLTGDGTHTYTYDTRRRMATSVTGGVTTTYSLNGLGERVRKINVGLTGGYTEYLYDNAGHLIGEYDGTGATIQETGWFGDMPLTVAAAGTHYFIAPDHLNAPRTIGDGTGAYVWSWARDPFGITQPTTSGGFGGYNLRFPGQYYDSETSLSYNMNRDYNPALGRYVQSDPIGLAGGINTYGYVGGNPVGYIDPSGLTFTGSVVGGVIGGVIGGALDPAGGEVPGAMWGSRIGGALTDAIALNNALNENAEEQKDGPEEKSCPPAETNPYKGSVKDPVIVVDSNGNAIPVDAGQSIASSPNGDYQQVLDSNGNPTGTRYDRGGHRGAPFPHGHVPGVTLPNGDPHLPLRQ